VVADWDDVQAVPLHGGPAVPLGPGCTAVASDDPAVVWIAPCDPDGRIRAVEVATGVERPDVLALPIAAQLVGRTSAGLVVQAPSGIYVADGPGGAPVRRVADGQVLAVMGERVVRAVCDDQLACSLSALDPATGDDRPLTAPPEAVAAAGFRVPTFVPQVSPDAQRAAVTLFDWGDSSVWVVDLEAGSVDPVPGAETRGGGALGWSADGRWLLFQGDDGAVQAWRADLGLVADARGLPDGRLVGTLPDHTPRPLTGEGTLGRP
jgi:hypothetical protein